MIIGNPKTKIPIGINMDCCKIKHIEDFMQGAVYCLCKNNQEKDREHQWFSARDFLGGRNRNWKGTPMQYLFDYYSDNGCENAEKEAGQMAGCILKNVIIKDRREFETRKDNDNPREYRWTGLPKDE